MEKGKSRRLILVSLAVIVGLSAYLRLSGITWGINTGYGHNLNFHPDEFISIGGVSPIMPLAGKFKAPSAYFEGTFNYYLWAVPEMVHQLCSGAPPIPEPDVPPGRIKFLLLSSRIMTVLFDLLSVLLLFVVISEITGQYLAGLFGALLYGILPMQVIYSHFMRTYALSNLLCVLVIWLSVKAVKQRYWVLFVVTGVVGGLAAATRYSTGVVVSVPCLFVVFQDLAGPGPWLRALAKSTMYLLSGPLWLLLGGFVLGLLLGEPMLLLDFKSVYQGILFEVSHYAPAGRRNPFELAPVWRYLSVLIPYATYPLLWLPLYLSTLYVIFRRSLWPTVLPLSLFAACYSYAMAKGYIDVFARLVMLILPVFCIFAGLAFAEIAPRVLKRPILAGIGTIVILLVITPTIIFDVAYGCAMQGRDVREMLLGDMQRFIKTRSSTTIAVSEGGGYFYTAMPAVGPLKSGNVAVDVESTIGKPADFYVMGFERPLDENLRRLTICQMESSGEYRFIKAYSHVPTVFGKTLDLSKFPADMTYPFPTILLLRKVPNQEIASADGKIKVTVPGAWRKMPQHNKQTSLQAGDKSKQMYLIVITQAKADLDNFTLEKHHQQMRDRMLQKMENASATEPVSLTIDGHPALQDEVSGTQNRTNVVFLHTTIDDGDHSQQILAWTLKSRWQQHKEQLREVIRSFRSDR